MELWSSAVNRVQYLIVVYKRECLCQKLHAVIEAQSIWFGNVRNLGEGKHNKEKTV